MTAYDIVIILALLISVATGFMRGGAREIVTLFALIVGVLAAGLLLPLTGPLFRKFIHPEWIGTVTALLLVFVLAYAAVHLLGGWASQKMRQSQDLGRLDRTAGAGFGVLRALVIIGAFHLGFAAITPHNRLPAWFHHAKLYRVSAASARTIQIFLPRVAKAADAVAPQVERSIRTGASDPPRSTAKGGRAYSQRQRASMDKLVEKTR
jgi:membrane protein required for colicin V production